MKLLVSLASLGLASYASAHDMKEDCKNLSSMKGVSKCMVSLLKENKLRGKMMDIMSKEMKNMHAKLEEKNQPSVINVHGDYHVSCDEDVEEDPRMNGVPEFLKTPKHHPESSTDWTLSDYHYYMNCADEVEMRIWNEFQQRDPNLPMKGFDIPEEPYFRIDPTNFTVGDIANEGFSNALEALDHPWGWATPQVFYTTAGAHGREMMSWASDEVKDFWRTRQSWYKDEVADEMWYLWGFVQNIRYKYCSGLPTHKRIWGTPVREDGCNPKYPYTSWVDEGFDTTAEECDKEFIHEHPKSLSDDRFVTGDNLS